MKDATNLPGPILCDRRRLICGLQVALGLPLLPKVPISRTEAKRRASVKLLPLGMALLAAESFVQERLHSADICMNVLGS